MQRCFRDRPGPRPALAAGLRRHGEDELVARRKASGKATPALSILSTGKDIYRPRYKLQNHRLKDFDADRQRKFSPLSLSVCCCATQDKIRL